MMKSNDKYLSHGKRTKIKFCWLEYDYLKTWSYAHKLLKVRTPYYDKIIVIIIIISIRYEAN
jgi:hypothetical protein